MEKHISPTLEEQWLDRLQAGGYRLTRPLKIVVEILSGATHALTPVDIFDLGRREYPRMGLVTVYRTLDILSELGLVRKLHLQHGCHTYAVSPAAMQAAGHLPDETLQPAEPPVQHAHHVICQQCQRAVEFAGCDIAAVVAQVEAQTGYRVRDHWLEMFGICPECQARAGE